MANTTGLPVLFATGNHASRPAASAVGSGGLYSCTTHSLVYQSDGVSTWSTWANLAGSTTRASLGLDTTDSPQFAGLNVGAATDTTITRTGAGDIAVEGNALYRAGGTDVPITDGGTGASTKAAAFDALSPMTTAGDIIIGGASGTGTRLAAGTATNVLTSNGAGSAPSWQAGGGGGGSDLVQTYSGAGSKYIPGLLGDPHRMPASPNAADNEFQSATGTVLGTLDTDNVTDAPSWWHLKRTTTGVEVDGRYWTIPSLPCTIEAGFRFVIPTGNHASVGIMLLDATPTAIRNFELNAAGGTYNFSLRRYTNRTTFATSVDVAIPAPVPASLTAGRFYIRLLVTSSSSVTASYSYDGFFWTSPASLTAISPTLTPGFFGFEVSDPVATGGTRDVFIDYLRVT